MMISDSGLLFWATL